MERLVPNEKRIVVTGFRQSGTHIDKGRTFTLWHKQSEGTMWLCIWDVSDFRFHDGDGVCENGFGYWVYEHLLEAHTEPLFKEPTWEL